MSAVSSFAVARSITTAIGLVVIAVGAHQVAGVVSAGLALRLSSRASAEADPALAEAPPAARAALGAIATRNLLGARRERLDGPLQDASASLEPCSQGMGLRAAVVSAVRREWSLVVALVDGESRIFTLNEGSDEIGPDARLVDIRERAVVVRRGTRLELCGLDGSSGSRAAAAGGLRGQRDVGMAVTRVGEDTYALDPGELARVLADPGPLMDEARVVPRLTQGIADGLTVVWARPGSVVSRLGLQNGDVLRSINGYPLSDYGHAIEAYGRLRDASSFNLDIERRGVAMSLRYRIGR